MSKIVKEDLKEASDDEKVKSLKEKLMQLEQDIVKVIE